MGGGKYFLLRFPSPLTRTESPADRGAFPFYRKNLAVKRGSFIFMFVSISRILFRQLADDSHLSRMIVANHLKRYSTSNVARPCTRVRILPFHPSVSTGLFPKESFAFRLRRHCSHLLRYRRRALPATLLPRLTAGNVRTFLTTANAA